MMMIIPQSHVVHHTALTPAQQAMQGTTHVSVLIYVSLNIFYESDILHALPTILRLLLHSFNFPHQKIFVFF